MYRVRYAHDVLTKDIPKLKSAHLMKQFLKEMDNIKQNPNVGKMLTGPLKGKRSVRINVQHRVFYTFDNVEVVVENQLYKGTVSVLQAFGHDFN